ncbi:leucine-rich repeat domain-containing protein [Aquimarina rubra]|uniref:Leucine-rich repeat domain-containing protein n=1 Tax=Aquimarina rubra TaxID=1920033 RepID=A0ABW5LEA4_9FLAO
METQIQQIEQLFNIKLEKHDYNNKNQVNTYTTWTQLEGIKELKLEDIKIDDIELLLPFSKNLHTLKLINCTIGNIAELYNFEGLCNVTLDNVCIQDLDELYQNKRCTTDYDGNLRQVNLKNMEIKHLGVLQPMAKNLDHVFITNCTLHNFYEVNLFPKLYDLRLNGVTLKQSDKDRLYKPNPDRNFTWLSITKMKIEDISFFAPISKGLHGITINSCSVGSIRKLSAFTELKELEIDSSTSIKDRESPQDQQASFLIKECIVGEERTNPKAKVDLHNLVSVAQYIKSLHFHQYVPNSTAFLSNFSQLEKLEFTYSSVLLSDFLPIADQIKKISFNQSECIDPEALQYFKKLERIEIETDPHQLGLKDFKKIGPLQHQLKKLKINEDEVANMEAIREFTALESLDIEVQSIAATESVLSLSTLSKLDVYIDIESEPTEPIVLDLQHLKNIEELVLGGTNTFKFIGFEHLKHLKKLTLFCDCKIHGLETIKNLEYLSIEESIDINKIPAMDSLKTLVLEVDKEYEIYSLEQFPNLENLKIQATNNIHLGKLSKLKVLYILWVDIETTTCFDNLPNLEKLDLACRNLSVIKNLDKLTNLKMLNLSENKIQNIEGLANLKSLERLNLYENEISDISVLNTLPNLKEVNLAGNKLVDKEFKKQLQNPEIAVFYGIGRVPFWIWKDRCFKL